MCIASSISDREVRGALGISIQESQSGFMHLQSMSHGSQSLYNFAVESLALEKKYSILNWLFKVVVMS